MDSLPFNRFGMPDFLCIGAPKAGTSWLYQNLKTHPSIWLPPVKEIHFFDERPAYFSRLIAWAFQRRFSPHKNIAARIGRAFKNAAWDELSWLMRYYFGKRDIVWYTSLFGGHPGKLKGDITPNYGLLPDGRVDLIRRLMPGARIIFIMRDPVQRAWSAVRMAMRSKKFNSEADFLRYIEAGHQRLAGDYTGTIDRWRRHFAADQFKTVFFDEIETSPRELLRSIYRFLGVSDSETISSPDVETKINAGIPYPMPESIAKILAGMFRPELERLCGRFGGPAGIWLKRAELCLNR